MLRRSSVAWGLVALAFSAAVLAGDKPNLGKAKEALAREFKGQRLQLRSDVLAPVLGNEALSTTATPEGVTYPNADQPRQFAALAWIEVFFFRTIKGRVHVVVMRPGFKPNSFLAAATQTEGERMAAWDANMAQVILAGEDAATLRASFGRLFYLDGVKPSDDDLRRCLARGDEHEPAEIGASRCGVSPDRAAALRQPPAR